MLRVLRPERNWDALCLFGFTVIAGLGGLLSPTGSRAIESAFPGWAQAIWYGGLMVGGSAGLIGALVGTIITIPDNPSHDELKHLLARMVTGETIERFARLLLAGLCISYVIGAFIVASDRIATALGVIYVLGFAAACLARSRQLRLNLRRVHDRLHDIDGTTE